MLKPLDRIELTAGGPRYFLGGHEVAEAEYRAQYPEPSGLAGPDALVHFRPLASVALGVHPDQVPEAREDAKRLGVPTEFTPGGRPVFTSSRHMRRYCKAYGYVHKGY